MRVLVLHGGPSVERDVSLKSGAAVADGLRAAGHDVTLFDLRTPADLGDALESRPDVVFPALHGAYGESGELQRDLDARGVRYVGSGARASALAIDKLATKKVWHAAGIPTPPWHEATSASLGGVGAPCAVKALASGSSLDVFLCRDEASALAAVENVVKAHGRALVEKMIDGVELTVGVLGDDVLPPLRIAPKAGAFFDYDQKYAPTGGAEHRFDLNVPDELVEAIKATVLKAHRTLGCRHLSRTDVMVDAGGFYLLELNTMPGFTPRSLLPEMAAKAGVGFPALVDRLVRMACPPLSS